MYRRNPLVQAIVGTGSVAILHPKGWQKVAGGRRKRFLAATSGDAQGSPDEGDPTERGFADVWKKDCFAWEYKGRKKKLEAVYKQLQRYRESLLNPPLLVVCDFDRYIVRTNFNGTVMETHEFTNDQIDLPDNLRILPSLFDQPDYLKPQRTTAQATEKLAVETAAVVSGHLMKRPAGLNAETQRGRAATKEDRGWRMENGRARLRGWFCARA